MSTFYPRQTDYIEKLNELDTGVTGSASAAAASAAAALVSETNAETAENNAAVSAAESTASAETAALFADQAAAAANYQGVWSAGTYTLGESVTHNSDFWIADATTTDEPLQGSDWSRLPSFEFLKALNKEINANTTVATFIYIPAIMDHDGGAWTTQSRHTSWYNEDLNTATRGATRDFPPVALIVAEADTVTIYDATDSSLPMWMVFNNVGGSLGTGGLIYAATVVSNFNIGAVSTKGGRIYFNNIGLTEVDFVNNTANAYTAVTDSSNQRKSTKGLADRNTAGFWTLDTSAVDITNSSVNATAITQDDSGNNIVYVGSDGGLDRIDTSDGSVSSWTDNAGSNINVQKVSILDEYVYWSVDTDSTNDFILTQLVDQDLTDTSASNWDRYTGVIVDSWASDLNPIHYGSTLSIIQAISHNAFATNRSLTQIIPNPSSWGHGLLNTTTDTWQSGWQYGDIHICLVSDASNSIADVSYNNITPSGTVTTQAVATGAETQSFTGSGNITATLDSDVSATGSIYWWEKVSGVWELHINDLTGGTDYVNNVAGTVSTNVTLAGTALTILTGVEVDKVRVSDGVMSEEQRTILYQTARHAFQEGAQFSTSALDITAIDYNETTQELIEQTASGWTKRGNNQLVVHESGADSGTVISYEDDYLIRGSQ